MHSIEYKSRVIQNYINLENQWMDGEMMKEIQLSQGKFALIDDEDYDFVIKFRWHAARSGNTYYARARIPKDMNIKGAMVLHRLIMLPNDWETVDHIDGDGLNNQKSNLRIISHRENCCNRHVRKTSKFAGVSWHEYNKRWRSQIRIGDKRIELGHFHNELDAAQAYLDACKGILT